MLARALLAGGLLAAALPIGMMASTGPGQPRSPIGIDRQALAVEIPEPMLGAYLDAANVWDLDWALLAAIGKIECDHGRYQAPGCNPPGTINSAGARGPMQFLGSTWRTGADRYQLDAAGPPAIDGHGWATDGNGDGIADPWNPHDAVHGAARFLIALGGRDDPRLAAKRYYAGPANPNPNAGEDYATRAAELIAEYHALAATSPTGGAFMVGEYALPFDPAGLHAVTTHATPPRDPETQLTKPHHSGRIAADIPLPVGTVLYAIADSTVTWTGPNGDCGNTITLTSDREQAVITYCHLSRIDTRPSDLVIAGTPLGLSGGAVGTPGAGNSTGPHLHLHIDTSTGRRCPQPLLHALWQQQPTPTLTDLPTTGCT